MNIQKFFKKVSLVLMGMTLGIAIHLFFFESYSWAIVFASYSVVCVILYSMFKD